MALAERRSQFLGDVILELPRVARGIEPDQQHDPVGGGASCFVSTPCTRRDARAGARQARGEARGEAWARRGRGVGEAWARCGLGVGWSAPEPPDEELRLAVAPPLCQDALHREDVRVSLGERLVRVRLGLG